MNLKKPTKAIYDNFKIESAMCHKSCDETGSGNLKTRKKGDIFPKTKKDLVVLSRQRCDKCFPLLKN